MRILSLSFFLIAASLAVADTAKDNADGQAAIALAKAKARTPSVVSHSKPVTYAEAVKIAVAEGRAVFITVGGLDCTGLCVELRPLILTCHEKDFGGDKTPRAILAFPADGKLVPAWEWKEKPRPADVKKLVETWRASHTKTAEAVIDALVLSLVSLEPGELGALPPAGYQQVCDGNGHCHYERIYNAMPAGQAAPPAGVDRAAPDSEAVDAGVFIARHGRLSRFRSRFRHACGLPPPMIQGEIVQSVMPGQAVAAQPLVTGGPVIDLVDRMAIHRKLHIVLRDPSLTPAQRAVANEVLADADLYGTACKIAHTRLAKSPTPAGTVGKLGDGTILQMLLADLPQLIAAIEAVLRLIHG